MSIELELREQAIKRGWPHNELLNAAADRIAALEAALWAVDTDIRCIEGISGKMSELSPRTVAAVRAALPAETDTKPQASNETESTK